MWLKENVHVRDSTTMRRGSDIFMNQSIYLVLVAFGGPVDIIGHGAHELADLPEHCDTPRSRQFCHAGSTGGKEGGQ